MVYSGLPLCFWFDTQRFRSYFDRATSSFILFLFPRLHCIASLHLPHVCSPFFLDLEQHWYYWLCTEKRYQVRSVVAMAEILHTIFGHLSNTPVSSPSNFYFSCCDNFRDDSLLCWTIYSRDSQGSLLRLIGEGASLAVGVKFNSIVIHFPILAYSKARSSYR